MIKCMKTLHETKEKCKQKTLKTWNKPGSSHPYTQRQLVLERKLKSTCPQVRPFIPKQSVKTGYHFSEHRKMHFCASSRVQRKQLTSTYPSNRADSSSLRQDIELHPSKG